MDTEEKVATGRKTDSSSDSSESEAGKMERQSADRFREELDSFQLYSANGGRTSATGRLAGDTSSSGGGELAGQLVFDNSIFEASNSANHRAQARGAGGDSTVSNVSFDSKNDSDRAPDSSKSGFSKSDPKQDVAGAASAPENLTEPSDAAHDAGHTQTDELGNQVVTDAQGNTTITSADGNTETYIGADGRGYRRVYNEGGFTETHYGPDSRDNYELQRINGADGSYRETYTYGDPALNHTRDVGQDGRIVITDAVGLRLHMMGGSPEFQQRILDRFLATPLSHRLALSSAGYQIFATDRVSEVFPDLEGIGRRRNVDIFGAHNPFARRIAVGEFSTNGGLNSFMTPENVLSHEMGHAFDYMFGPRNTFWGNSMDSAGAEFINAMQQDIANFSDPGYYDAFFDRYLREGFGTGRAELFANLYAAIISANPNAHAQDLLTQFPRLAALLRSRLAGRFPAL